MFLLFKLPRCEETIGKEDISKLWLFQSFLLTLYKEQALVDTLVARVQDLYHTMSNVRELADDFEQSTRPIAVDIGVIDLALPHLQLWHGLSYGFLTPVCFRTQAPGALRCLFSALFLIGDLPQHPTLYCEAFMKLSQSLKMLADSCIKSVNSFVSFDIIPSYDTRQDH
ncbi:hypothetical protein BDQ17DRAFT_352662 [Cyathus striatus]|nr:hypothetical protein BDQ17DRAFT_352662 [Cyathus striatus]